MLHILFGPDSYSKQRYIQKRAALTGTDPVVLDPSQLKHLPSGGDLFSVKKVYLVAINNIEETSEDIIANLKAASDEYIVVQDKLDQRKTATKKLLKDTEIKSVGFMVPTGGALKQWIQDYLDAKSKKIESAALSLFLERIGAEAAQQGFGEPKYDLWQVGNELDKLYLYADGTITKSDVEALIMPAMDTEVFGIINALGRRDKQGTLSLLDLFFSSTTATEEKAKVIQCAALLADQFRSLLLVKSSQEAGITEQSFLGQTGWKSGRLHILKGLSRNFETKKLLETLKKFEFLDVELKTTQTPPRVLLDLIITQVL